MHETSIKRSIISEAIANCCGSIGVASEARHSLLTTSNKKTFSILLFYKLNNK
jgi:hypothetical protein